MPKTKLERYERDYGKDEVIMHEGSMGDTIFLIKSGKVEVIKESDGIERVITTLGEGKVIGELSLTEERHQRSATVRTLTEVEGWKFPNDQFETLVHQNKEFRIKILSSLTSRVKNTNNRLIEALEYDSKFLKLSLIALALLDSEEWANNDSDQKLKIDHTIEFLSFKFDTSLKAMGDFISLVEDFSLDRFQPDERENNFKIGHRIIDELINKFNLDFEFSEEFDDELVDASRKAKRYLEELEDDSENIDRSKLQNIMEDRKNMKEVLSDRKKEGKDAYLVNHLEKLLNSIEREVNVIYNQQKN